MKTSQICSDDTGRCRALRAHRDQGHADLNGIDYIEVSEADQTILHVRFMDRAPIIDQTSNNFTKANVVIKGGRRIRNIRVVDVRICQPDDVDEPDCMEVKVDRAGDFSTYTLCLFEVDKYGHSTNIPLTGIDPRYVCVDFSFKANCPSDLDCQTVDTCPPATLVEPEINYLAKDYSSFRQLILDRLALIMPDWQERHVPDLGITLVEILAYVGDYLSYYQDAVATEAYLETARQRISVRRHTRLVDYPMHEGCNARTWLFIETDGDIPLAIENVYFITGHNNTLPVASTMLTEKDLQGIPSSHYEVFEPLHLTEPPQKTIQLYQCHNRILFYTWGEKACCLPRGATSAMLRDSDPNWKPPSKTPLPAQSYNTEATKQHQNNTKTPSTEPPRILDLKVGDVLIFEEVEGPKTGNAADADPTHRHAVRLTHVKQDIDPLYNIPILEIAWGEEDKLPFPLCLSAIGPAPKCDLLTDISVARGNVILIDYGRTVTKTLDLQPPSVEPPVERCEGKNDLAETTTLLAPYNPCLKEAPLTFYQPLPVDAPFFSPASLHMISATSLLKQEAQQSVPWITLTSTPPKDGGTLYKGDDKDEDDEDEREIEGTDKPGKPDAPQQDKQIIWRAKRDLLESQSDDYDFVVEMDNDGNAYLRFGDGELGHAPANGMQFTAKYRVGNGLRGNVGADSITHIVFKNPTSGVTLRPRNPIAASGGTDPEPLAEVKLFAPHAFRTNKQRAITADDYAELAQRNPNVQRAAATLRWTGSWYEALVAIDPKGKEVADQTLLDQIEAYLEHYRRIGHDLKVVGAHYVPLDIAMTICVAPHYLRGHVKAALLEIFSNRVLSNGQLGFFHPDNLTFGVGIAVSKLVAMAQAVSGVQSVAVSKLERLQEGPNDELINEFLPIGPTEIAQLDNDPGFPENGKLVFTMVGGR